MSLTILIPARNEEENLPVTLENIENKVKVEHELLVIDDHSVDRTREILFGLQKKYPKLRFIPNNTHPGFTNAIKKGFSEARGEFVVVVMADNCDDPESINLMYEKARAGYDVVCGSRYMQGGKKIGGRFLQTMFSKFVGYSLHFLTGIPIHDISNAFKMYRVKALNDIQIEEAGFASSLEIILKLYKKGFTVTEIPTTWKDRIAGKSNFKLLKVARNYIRWYLWALFIRRSKERQ